MVVIVTDAKYRASVAAIRSIALAGHDVVAVQTKTDAGRIVPAFSSRLVKESFLLECSVKDKEEYKKSLIGLCQKYSNTDSKTDSETESNTDANTDAKSDAKPVLFPVGAATLSLLSENREEMSAFCHFVCASPDTLSLANDKDRMAKAAREAGIGTPKNYEKAEDVPEDGFPVIVKPKCGEKFGLRAKDRYAIAKNRTELLAAVARMSRYGGSPVIQEKIQGDGIGVSLLMADGKAVSAICHRRIREYPHSGGPSACCESFCDEKLVRMSEKLLASIGFEGIAMVEYKLKGSYDEIIGNSSLSENAFFLEVNPRIWGSFALTFCARSAFSEDYVKVSGGELPSHPPCGYETGVRMRYILSDLAAIGDYLVHFERKKAFGGIRDLFSKNVCDGINVHFDKKPFRKYLLSKIIK